MKGHRRTSNARVSNRQATDVIAEGNGIFAIGTMTLRDRPAGWLIKPDPPAPRHPPLNPSLVAAPLAAAWVVAADNSLVASANPPVARDGWSVASAGPFGRHAKAPVARDLRAVASAE